MNRLTFKDWKHYHLKAGVDIHYALDKLEELEDNE